MSKQKLPIITQLQYTVSQHSMYVADIQVSQYIAYIILGAALW